MSTYLQRIYYMYQSLQKRSNSNKTDGRYSFAYFFLLTIGQLYHIGVDNGWIVTWHQPRMIDNSWINTITVTALQFASWFPICFVISIFAWIASDPRYFLGSIRWLLSLFIHHERSISYSEHFSVGKGVELETTEWKGIVWTWKRVSLIEWFCCCCFANFVVHFDSEIRVNLEKKRCKTVEMESLRTCSWESLQSKEWSQ